MLTRLAASGLSAVITLSLAAPAVGHPHVFTDAGYRLIFDDQGRLAQISTDWRYDELFTLLMVEDKGADGDGDGDISTSELAILQDFDSNWPDDYNGDLHLSHAGQPVTVGAPHGWSVAWRDGQLISTHTRDFDPPLDLSAGALRIRPFDPGYYVAYAVTPEPEFQGRTDCSAQIIKPDMDAEAQKVADEIAAIPPDADLAQMGYLEVGERFAETVVVTCAE